MGTCQSAWVLAKGVGRVKMIVIVTLICWCKDRGRLHNGIMVILTGVAKCVDIT